MTEQDYIDYWTLLASQHTAIGHTPEQPRLYVIHDNNLDELTKALRNSLRLPAVLIDQCYDDVDRTRDNRREVLTGGINVLVKCDTANPLDVRRARQQARELARQFLYRMDRDAQTPGSALYRPGLLVSTQFRGEPFEEIPGTAGWGYPTEWTMPLNTAVSVEAWADLAPAPTVTIETIPDTPAPIPPVVVVNQD